jgi:enoyl-CoA hydratase/carnithine racemase
MSDISLIRVEVKDSVAILTLNRPKQLNALNQAVLEELDGHLTDLEKEPDVRAIILRGEGRAFAAGADIAQMKDFSAAEAEHFSKVGGRAIAHLEQMAVPTIALIHGFSLGGGLELALACDIRIAAEGTKFGQPEVTLAVVPGFGGSQRLPRIIGRGRALELLLTGELINAQKALDIGLVTHVVPAEELMTIGLELAAKLCKLAPKALSWVKRAVYDGTELDLSKGLAFESTLFGLSFSTQDQSEGMAAFLEKRRPNFTGE